MAIEPQFADGIRNYASNAIVEPLVVVRRPIEIRTGIGEVTTQPVGTSQPPVDHTAGEGTVVQDADVDLVEPTRDVPADPGSSLAPSRTYEVQPGDSLWTIAQSELGSGHRWQELYETNRNVIGDDPMRLRAGMVLTIP